MRHVLAAASVATCTDSMGMPPSTAGLVTPPGGALAMTSGSLRAGAGAIDLAAVATAADQRLAPTARAQKQPSWWTVSTVGAADATWTNATIEGIMPLHACPARCGARRRTSLPSSDRRRACPAITASSYPAIRRCVSPCPSSPFVPASPRRRVDVVSPVESELGSVDIHLSAK
jgi:hypothetical protein